MSERRVLTPGEIEMARSVFADAIDYDRVRIVLGKWWPFQPRGVVMAPTGNIHFHPQSRSYREDFSKASLPAQGLFIHEMTHVWQTQVRGEWWLILNRPFSRRYDYSLKPGWGLERYGIEQQAEIVRHAFLLRNGVKLAGVAGRDAYDVLVNFPGARR